MKLFLLILLAMYSSLSIAQTSNGLFTAYSQKRGISAFNMEVKEVEVGKRFSVLDIPNFQGRTAQASRWLMCVYTELAIMRNAAYWASIYDENSGDKVTLVFPKVNALTDPAFSGVDQMGVQPQIMLVETFKPFCGLN